MILKYERKIMKIICSYIYFEHLWEISQIGIEVTNRGCCGLGEVEVAPFCIELTPVCNDASKYVYWDSYHLSEVSYQYLAKYLEAEVLPQFNF